MKTIQSFVAAAVIAAASGAAQAALVTSFSPDTTIDFETIIGGPGPVDLNGDARLTGFGLPPGSLEVGAPAFWALGDNGFWSLGKTFAGHDSAVGGMIVSFKGQSVASVGAFFNYLKAPAGNPMQLLALDVDGAVLEGHSVTIGTPDGVNEGAFYGISRSSADIGYLVVTAPYVVMDDLAYTAPVPEPGTYAMVLGGLGLLGLAARRRRG